MMLELNEYGEDANKPDKNTLSGLFTDIKRTLLAG
jgi:hypothetical protein